MEHTIKQHVSLNRAAGFTLIELMIAMVLGLIVIGAVLALSLSMIRANSDTISATRLTQELRATSALVTSELQRAGSAENPFLVKTLKDNGIGDIDTTAANCIRYNVADASGTAVSRSISMEGGSVYIGSTACGAGGTKLSSNQVNITNLQFTRSGRTLTVSLTGQLPAKPGVYRQYSQTVFAPGLGT